MRFNDEQYVLRSEFFGGLLINKKNMIKYQISYFDTYFLIGIQAGFSKKKICQMIDSEYNVKFIPDISQFVKMGVLIETVSIAKSVVDKQLFQNKLYDLKDRKNTNYLRSPIELTIYPTLSCQLSCEFCFAKSIIHKSNEHSYQEWIKLIDSFIEEGTVSISILGGEPFLYHDLIPLLNELRKRSVKVSITTNGQYWTDELIELIAASQNITVIISLESLDENFDCNQCGDQYRLQKTIKFIRLLSTKGKTCRINSVYTSQTDKQLFSILDFCNEMHIEKYSLVLCYLAEMTAQDIQKLNATGLRLKNYIEEKNYKSLRFSVEGCMLYTADPNVRGNLVKSEFQNLEYGCECGNTILEITADGNMYSCAAFIPQNKVIGNAFSECWKTVWRQSNELNRLRNTKCTDVHCVNCDLYHFCNGGCPAFKEMNSVDDIYQICDSRCLRQNKGEI